ncbi:MAG: class I SAM-dependent methyltransferase [Pseudomonadota bacterium]
MAERTTGLYRLITIPGIYELVQNCLGGKNSRQAYRDQYFSDIAGKRVLEVGCGPGTAISVLSDCSEYIGMDWNSEHIERANARFGDKHIKFICGDVSKDLDPEFEQFDYILAFGILHHLDDGQASGLLKACADLLDDDGRFLSIDPAYHDGQNFFAKWIIDRDSGQDIRREEGYRGLAQKHFNRVETNICTDKLRIPYSHCVVIASR